MIFVHEERKGGNANGRRDFDKEELPQGMKDLLNK